MIVRVGRQIEKKHLYWIHNTQPLQIHPTLKMSTLNIAVCDMDGDCWLLKYAGDTLTWQTVFNDPICQFFAMLYEHGIFVGRRFFCSKNVASVRDCLSRREPTYNPSCTDNVFGLPRDRMNELVFHALAIRFMHVTIPATETSPSVEVHEKMANDFLVETDRKSEPGAYPGDVRLVPRV